MRRLLHRGSVMAWGVWLPPPRGGGMKALLGRVLTLWDTGCALYELEPWGHLVQFGQPRRLQCESCPGFPMVAESAGWSSYPDPLNLEPDCLALCWHGQFVQVARGQMRACDLGPWLKDVFADVVIGDALASPAGPPALAAPPAFSPREELPNVPPPSPKLQILLDRWKQQEGGVGSGAGSATSREIFLASSPPGPLLQWAAGAWDKLTSFFAPSHNQRYLREMVQHFESGNLNEALRYGIPLGGLSPQTIRRELGFLRPRQSLSIGPPARVGGVVPVSEQGESYLRGLYRKAAEQLLANGQIEEAVFVYTELLGDHGEALRVLEEHKLYRLAAALAQARNWHAPTQIRLWFLAGYLDQALDAARHSGHHLQAYQELKTRGLAEESQRWLWEWALHLVSCNRHASAIILLWGHLERHEQLLPWLVPALQSRGALAGQVTALWLSEPSSQDEFLMETIRGWLKEEEFTLESPLWGLIEGLRALPNHKRPVRIEWVCALCARDALRRAPQSLNITQGLIHELIRMSGDALLKTDAPPLPRRTIKTDQHWQEILRGAGAAPVLDAALMADGRLLCALGEAGVAVLSAAGRLVTLLPVAAERIVIPDEGDRYILMSAWGAEWRLSWLEGGTLKTRPWISARLATFCTHYDGDCWLVVVDGALYQIDAAGRLVVPWRSLWKVPLAGPVLDMTLGSDKLGLLLKGEKGELVGEFYSYRDLQLRNRRPAPPVGEQQHRFWSVTEDSLVDATFDASYTGSVALLGHRLNFQEAPQPPLKVTHGARWSLVEAPSELGTTVLAVSRAGRGRPANFFMRGVKQVSARTQGQLLIIADDLGSCRVADLERRVWVRNCSVRI